MTSSGVGYVYAIVACLTNGSFLVPFKFHKIAVLKIPPVVFQLYASIGIFLSSWISAAFLPINPDFVNGAGKSLEFVPYGFLGGVIMVLSMTLGFMATRKIGVALAQGIFGGLAIIVSYIWALLIFDEIPDDVGLSVAGVLLLVLGISGIAGSRNVAQYVLLKLPSIVSKSATNNTPLISYPSENKESEPIQIELGNETTQLTNSRHPISRKDYMEGVIFAVLCGVLGGTTLVPLHYVEISQGGLEYIPSFGTGVMITAPVVLFFNYYFIEKQPLPTITFDIGFAAGVLSGIIWNISNILSVGAIPILGYGVAFPLVHSAILISGLWGIFFFHEFIDLPFAEAVFFFCGGLIVSGAAMISIAA
eukprot:gene1074-1139_t